MVTNDAYMKKDAFYTLLLNNPDTHWYEYKDFNNKISLYIEAIASWSYVEWHYLFTAQPSLMFTHGRQMLVYKDIFTVQALKHFRNSETLFINWCTVEALTELQWSQVERRIPKYSVYRLILV